MLNNIFDDLDDFEKIFELGFGAPKRLAFNTDRTKDMMPAHWRIMTDKDGNNIGYKAVCRTVGIDEKDVKIEARDFGISVKGESEYEGQKYNTYFELPISKDVMANIKKIDYKTLNGLTYIYLYVETPEKKKFLINKL